LCTSPVRIHILTYSFARNVVITWVNSSGLSFCGQCLHPSITYIAEFLITLCASNACLIGTVVSFEPWTSNVRFLISDNLSANLVLSPVRVISHLWNDINALPACGDCKSA